MSALIFIAILVHFYAILMKVVMLNERIFLIVILRAFLGRKSTLVLL